MTDNTNPPTGDPQQPAPKPGETPPVQIPKERLDKEIAKRHDAEARLAAIQGELDKLKNEVTGPTAPAESAPPQNDIVEMKRALAELQARELRRDLQSNLKLDEKQSDAVAKIMSVGLSKEAALAAARVSNADLFKAEMQRGFDPSQHGSLPARGTGAPTAATLKDRIGEVKVLPSDQRTDAMAEVLGKHLRHTLGWPQ